MIYSLVGTHKDIREKGMKELASLGEVSHHIYSEQVKELDSFFNARSMFGDTVIIYCGQLFGTASSKDVKETLIGFLDDMQTSSNIFIIDEPFADIHLVNRLKKVSKKLFDAQEEKIKDTSVFGVCDAFIKRDKKSAWIAFMDIREKVSGESLHGALWWKFQTEWSRVKEGKRSLFTETDCEKIGGELVRMSILAHRGESDLMVDLEKLIVSI